VTASNVGNASGQITGGVTHASTGWAPIVIRLEDEVTGEVRELGEEIRDEVIAREHSAGQFNEDAPRRVGEVGHAPA